VELTGAVLDLPGQGPTALPLVEIRPKSGLFFDYERKYTPGATEEICPARLDPAVCRKGEAAALAAHECLGLLHWSRTDMIAADGEVYVLEINTIPGMTATSLFPQAAAAVGLDLAGLLERLVELALRDRPRPH
jgi:D-alanine-D-alanine ligase